MHPKLHDIAAGRWPGILRHLGFDERVISGRHGPCPICGGRDRFRFDDKGGRGTWFCSHCGAGDGPDLLMQSKGWDFRTTAREVESIVGTVQARMVTDPRTDDDKRAALNRVWKGGLPVSAGDPVEAYLAGRGLRVDGIPDALRYHPALRYHDDDGNLILPAMVARITDRAGRGVSIHRTYIDASGSKADVASPKKLMPAVGSVTGAAVRLSATLEHIGIAEGIETALAAHELFGVPTWAALTAHGVEYFEPPVGIHRVTIFADHDENFVGQRAAFVAAARLSNAGIKCNVQTPEHPGDWLDVLNWKN